MKELKPAQFFNRSENRAIAYGATALAFFTAWVFTHENILLAGAFVSDAGMVLNMAKRHTVNMLVDRHLRAQKADMSLLPQITEQQQREMAQKYVDDTYIVTPQERLTRRANRK